MGTHGLPDVSFIIVDGYDFKSVITRLEDFVENGTENLTVAGESIDHEGFVGVQNAGVQWAGFYDSVLGAGSGGALSLQTGTHVLTYGIAGNSYGVPVECAGGVMGHNYQRIIENGAYSKMSHELQMQQALESGYLVGPYTQRTTAGNVDTNNTDSLAAGSNGCQVYYAVTQLTLGGYTNLSLTARHSTSNGSGHATISGSTQTFTNVGSAKLSCSGTINRYLSMAWAWTGAGSGMSATFLVGIVKNP